MNMATVNLTVEVPDDEVAQFRRELVDLCFDFGLPVDDEDEFEEDDTDPCIELPPAHSAEEEANLREFLEGLCIVVVVDG
jgi:hypothetical protein